VRIGVIGSGRIGATVGELWAKSGHEVLLSSRHPERLAPLVARLGERASAGMPEEAATFGEAILLAVPFGAAADVGVRLAPALAGKVVLDAGNPFAGGDDAAAQEVARAGHGSGHWTAQHLPGARVVKAFNTVHFRTLATAAYRAGDRIGIPLASDDAAALDTTVRLVTDAGFDPVVVGPLDRAKDFDPGTPVWNTGMSGCELRRRFGTSARSR
jgi:8-hydroxy-5-deazaflavin:NADPH oxidoreductase